MSGVEFGLQNWPGLGHVRKLLLGPLQDTRLKAAGSVGISCRAWRGLAKLGERAANEVGGGIDPRECAHEQAVWEEGMDSTEPPIAGLDASQTPGPATKGPDLGGCPCFCPRCSLEC